MLTLTPENFIIYLVESTILLTLLEIFEIDKTLQKSGGDRHQPATSQTLESSTFLQELRLLLIRLRHWQ